jgi:hypothetical protein
MHWFPGMLVTLKKIPLIAYLLTPLGIAGSIFMSWLTPFGVGIFVDTLYYVSAARNLAAGIGMGRITGLGNFKPITAFPPFYSYVLAFFHLLKVTELTTARWISILAFGFSIILVGLIVFQHTHSHFFSVFSALLILLANPVLRIYSWAMTEALYTVLMLAGLLFLAIYLQTPLRRWLVFTAIFTSLTVLTRYIGVSLVGAFLIVILLNRQLSWRNRIKDLVVFLPISLLPILLYMLHNWLVSETLTHRVFRWHPISSMNIGFLLKTISSWGLMPQRLMVGRETLASAGIILCLAVIGLFWLLRSLPKPGIAPRQEFVLLLSAWFYTGLLIISLLFLDAAIRLENRILLPLYVLIMLLIAIGLALLWQKKTWLYRLPVMLICLWLAYFSVTRVNGAIIDLRSDGQGYASQQWQNSPTAEFVRLHDPSLIYTNDLTAIYFLAGKDSVAIPNAKATEADFTNMRANLTRPNSYMVIFGPLTAEFASQEQLTQNLSLVGSFIDGKVYQLP